MKKVLGVALALLFALPLTVVAEEMVITGKVKQIDRADAAFVLEDGTRLWVDERMLADLQEGEKVQATFATTGGKRVVIELDRRTLGSDHERPSAPAFETTNFGGLRSYHTPDSIQAGGED